jgi:hypothetical protein
MNQLPAFILLAGFSASTVVHADLLPPEAREAVERHIKNPKAYDQVDQYCSNKSVGQRCNIDGSVLSGGGGGECRIGLNPDMKHIDLSCRRDDVVVIDRKLGNQPFLADQNLCLKFDLPGVKENLDHENLTCLDGNLMPIDQFCTDKKIGADCVVSLTRNGVPETAPGVCGIEIEKKGFYYMGKRTAQRKVISCQAKERRTLEYKPVPWWQKLLQ